jgi:2-octaprenyl-6-methoxyphenol hydroxylase
MANPQRSGRKINVDALIVGAGMVGGPLALALAKAGLDIAVIDGADPASTLAAEFDGRSSAIAYATQRVLAATGVWERLAAKATPILDIRVADGDSPLFLHYDHAEIGGDALGYMVENRDFRKSVLDRLQNTQGVSFFAPSRAISIDRAPGGVRARISGGMEIHATLLIGADGRSSAVRHGAGIRIATWSYAQTAIVVTVRHERPHDNVAHEHFLPAGPFAILPLAGDRSSIVWTERNAVAPAILALDEEDFLEELSARFGDFLGRLAVLGGRWSYPLVLQAAESAIAHRLALVGDAYHAMHPIAGQGVNMGLRDVAALAETLIDAVRLGLDIGDVSVLGDYQRWRRFDNTLMLAATDGLNRLFSNSVPPVRLARDLGLAAVNRLPPLKRRFMRHAMGLAGDLPRMLRGEAL